MTRALLKLANVSLWMEVLYPDETPTLTGARIDKVKKVVRNIKDPVEGILSIKETEDV